MFTAQIKLFKPADVIFWFLLMLGAYFLQSLVASHAANHSTAVIEINGQVKYRLDLRKSKKYSLEEFNPPVNLRIDRNRIAVTENDCTKKICIKMGPISRSGQMIVCVPKKILIYIPVENEDQNSVKAITG